MKNIINDFYKPLLENEMFIHCETINEKYLPSGETWRINPKIGSGLYWVFNNNKGYNIKIHDFSFHKDFVMNMAIPECLSITWYFSIAGEELSPYRPLRSNVAKSFLGGYAPYRATIHKNIPITSVGIEYEPSYYDSFLKERYGVEYQSPSDAFRSIDETPFFPEIAMLMNQILHYDGSGLAAELFFDAKAAEALALVFERHRKINEQKQEKLPSADANMMDNLVAYIGDHYASNINNELLAEIACMSPTKLKKCFRIHLGCTITEYVLQVRLSHAEHLITYTDLPITQIAKAVGYTNAGRFAELFCKQYGILPMEYRRLAQVE